MQLITVRWWSSRVDVDLLPNPRELTQDGVLLRFRSVCCQRLDDQSDPRQGRQGEGNVGFEDAILERRMNDLAHEL
jgi:hypothetical protein